LDSLKNGFGNIVESVGGIFGGGENGDSTISSNLGKTFELIKLDIEDWVNDSILLFSEMTETVKDMAIAAGLAFGVSSLAGAAGRMPPGRRVPKTRAPGATKVAEKFMTSAAKKTPALVGRLALGLLGGPVGWAITAYGIYEVLQMFSDMDDSDIEELVKEGEMTEEEAAVLINARNAKKKLDDLTEQNKNLSPESFLSPYSGEQEQLDAVRMADEQKQKNDAEIKKLQSVVDKAASVFGQKEESSLPESQAKIKHGLKSVDIQQRREMLLSPGMGVAVPPSDEGVNGTGGSPTAVKPGPGLNLLNRIMDMEGITDQTIRDRINQLAQVESSLNPNAKGPLINNPRSSHYGHQAHGLLQIMPNTAPEVGFTAEDIKDPEKAAIAGVRYFMKNLGRFGGNLDAATISHHAGPGKGAEFLKTGTVNTVDVATGLRTMDYLSRVQSQPASLGVPSQATSGQSEQVQNLLGSVSPRMPAAAVAAASTSYGDTMRQSSVTNVSYNSPTTNNVQSGGKQQPSAMASASVVDSEFMKLLVGRTVNQ
jgi:hypothetical protein